MTRRFSAVMLALMLFAGNAFAQGGSPAYKDGMKIMLDSTGNKFVKFSTWATFWARDTKANPGTAVNGIATDRYTELLLKQFRFQVLSQLSHRYLIIADIGIDNQTFSSGGSPGGGNTGNGNSTFNGTLGKKAFIYLHDLWNQFAIFPDVDPVTGKQHNSSLSIGTGLHYWNGLSRMTSASSASYLALTDPTYNVPLIDLSDQYGRQMGVFIKGNIDRLAFRWAVNKPFTVLATPQVYAKNLPDSTFAVDDNAPGKLSTTAYAYWQFLEREDNQMPFTTGTYLGTKRVLNIGAGFYHTNDGTVTQVFNSLTSVFNRHPINLWAADVFADLPIGGADRWAFTAYSVFYHYNFGHDYLRFGSVGNGNVSMAPGYTGPVSQAGFGNAYPLIGTGFSWFSQAGLLLPKNVLNGCRIQPFGEFSLQEFERYGSSKFTFYSAGSNFYIDGHHAKVTIKYQTRPIVINNAQAYSRSSFIIATQVYL